MDTQATVNRARAEYREYLRNAHPDWAESSVGTHLSDAFYLYQNTVTPSFWKCFASDEAMEAAREALLDYLKHEVGSERAEERAGSYFRDLRSLKSFLDARGGVRVYVGYEYDAEARLYEYAKRVYEGGLSAEEAVGRMTREIPCLSAGSHRFILSLFSSMMAGKRYTWKGNTETTLYFIVHIGADYGPDRLRNALRATQENVKYYFEQTGNTSNSIRRGCKRIAAENGEDISFDEEIFEGIIPKEAADSVLLSDGAGVRYWLYAAGRGSVNWENDYRDGLMAVGWDGMGDLAQYGSKDEIRLKMRELYGENGSYKNQVHALWQFANEVKPGDIVYVKRGKKQLVGRGVVEGGYVYDETRGAYRNVRAVRWTDKGEWALPVPSVVKTLTDITPFSSYVKKLQDLFGDDEETPEDEKDGARETGFEPYTAGDFLQDVFMDEARYDTLRTLLLTEKNVILQGAPGVGKTFAAKRLAFSVMGEKDTSRVKMVQFHQSYSYEDFIMGFRPTETGFELKTGVFYEFCRTAAEDDRPYFFIIDEINRGNLSKIFGELFMLLENDKRGVELQLLYADERFSIPGNVHIIGMMNTADRSLALLDYALRRRFAFFDMPPAFDSEKFRAYMARSGGAGLRRLVAEVERLNKEIADDPSLGEGFRIGHSYFCGRAAVSDEWLRSVVEFKLVPLLKEYWFEEPEKAREWSQALWEAVK